MKSKLRFLFLAVEINLLLWIGVCGMAWSDASRQGHSWWRGRAEVNLTVLLIGVGFAAIGQHLAYYAIFKSGKDSPD